MSAPGSSLVRAAGRPKRAWRRGLSVLVAGALGLVLLEGLLRFLLFTDVGWIASLAAPLRIASRYASRESGREHWELRTLFASEAERTRQRAFDARFGWLKQGIDPATLRHADEAQLGARRPVLLYGDSYATCVVFPGECWQGLLERSELGTQFALLNYGVGGYGLDQCYLLLRATLDLYAERDPVVVIGILVDDDLDRCYLALRNHPKPCFTLEQGELVLHPLEQETPLDFVQAHPVEITSYLWRWFTNGVLAPERAVAWTDEADHVATKKRLNERILAEIQRELESRGLDFFFVLFHARASCAAEGPFSWREPFLYEQFAQRGIRFVSSKRWIRADARRTGSDLGHYYVASGPGLNHFTADTNRIVFEALYAGLEGRFEPYAYLAGADGR